MRGTGACWSASIITIPCAHAEVGTGAPGIPETHGAREDGAREDGARGSNARQKLSISTPAVPRAKAHNERVPGRVTCRSLRVSVRAVPTSRVSCFSARPYPRISSPQRCSARVPWLALALCVSSRGERINHVFSVSTGADMSTCLRCSTCLSQSTPLCQSACLCHARGREYSPGSESLALSPAARPTHAHRPSAHPAAALAQCESEHHLCVFDCVPAAIARASLDLEVALQVSAGSAPPVRTRDGRVRVRPDVDHAIAVDVLLRNRKRRIAGQSTPQRA